MIGDAEFRPLDSTDAGQLSALPVEGPHHAPPGVGWDPVVTYVEK